MESRESNDPAIPTRDEKPAESRPGSEPTPDRSPGPSAGPVLYLLVTLGVLAVFVWTLRPARPNVQPAPLRPQAGVCPRMGGQFTPTNFTDVPGLELASLSKERRNRVLLRLNMEVCPCGCNSSVAACLVSHTACARCKDRAKEIIAEER